MNLSALNICNSLVVDGNQDVSYHKAYISSKYSYKLSLIELFNCYKEGFDIFKYDTSDCITLILSDNIEVSLNAYNDSMHPVFLKISTNQTKEADSDILISLDNNHCCSPNLMKWQSDKKNQNMYARNENPEKIFTGYDDCIHIIENALKVGRNITDLTAINYCMSLNIKNNAAEYKGYLPASGQIWLVLKYLKLINYILRQLHCNTLPLEQSAWWTSTENYRWQGTIWSIFSAKSNVGGKNAFMHILPFFKRIR